MGHRFDTAEWTDLFAGLARALKLLTLYRAQPKGARDRKLLKQAVHELWEFAEYTLNALRELQGQDPDRWHEMGTTAKDLLAPKVLQKDYSRRLDQLELYRKKADYGSYARERSAHFTATDLENCLAELRELETEAQVLLRQRGWL